MNKKPMRELMPEVSAFIDEMREAFGEEEINAVIRAGIQGEPVFFASENGHEVGTPLPPFDGLTLNEIVVGSLLGPKESEGK